MSYQQLLQAIEAKQIDKLYLLYGEEQYLIEEIVEKIKNALIAREFESLNFFQLDGKDLTLEKLIDACETLPFMAERKLIIIKDFDAFQGKKRVLSETEEEQLAAYFSKIPDSTCLVFYGHSAIDNRKKLVKALGKAGYLIKLDRLKEAELNKWILDFVKLQGKKIEPRELSYFISQLDYFGKNASQTLMDITNEIKKIIAFMGTADKIEAAHIDQISIFKFQNDIFKLLDSLGKKNLSEAMTRLDDLLAEGEVLIRLMSTLSNQIKHILATKLLLDEGYSPKMVAAKIGIHPYTASKCAAQSKNYTIKRLRELLNLFLEMDYRIKSGKINDRVAMELLLTEMCR
ncbi:DNA polymerase III subunit delta [Alkaliphilus crotonatoxidans]